VCASSHDFDPSEAKKISSNNRVQERATRVKTKQKTKKSKLAAQLMMMMRIKSRLS
jgi:hypothetical protein